MSATPRVDALATLIQQCKSGPQGAAVPLTREQQLEQALYRIYSEACWAEKRRLPAHQRAMQRIRELVEAAPMNTNKPRAWPT